MAEEKLAASAPKIVLPEEPESSTLKAFAQPSSGALRPPPPISQGRAAGKLSVGRGDLDQAIRSMRDGTRRTRPNRPLNKIFVDGRHSRVFD